MIGGFETDHAYIRGSCHPSACAFPAALAVAERDHLDGKTFLASVALGYEVACRVGAAATRAVEDTAGFHGPGTNAPFGGAAAAAKALGLDSAGVVNALGVAGSHAGGLLEFAREGAMTKRLHVGRGAQTGLESALLAAQGFTGPSTVLEGDRGFLKVYSPSPEPHLLVEDLGRRYLMLDMTVKAYACHASFHPVIDALHRLRQEHGFSPEDVQRVQVAGSERMVARHDQREPSSVLGAQYSLPYSAAIALCHDISDPGVYNEGVLQDPMVRRLSSEMELAAVDGLGGPGGPVARLSVTVGGRTHSLAPSGWKGAPSEPCTFQDIAQKFRRYAAPHVSASRLEHIIDLVGDLESLGDAADLPALLRGQ